MRSPARRRYVPMRNLAWASAAGLLVFAALYAGQVEQQMEAGPPPPPQPMTLIDIVATIAYMVVLAWLLVGFVPPLMRFAALAALISVVVYEVPYQLGLTSASPGFNDGNIVWLGLVPAALLLWAARLRPPSAANIPPVAPAVSAAGRPAS